MKNYAPFEIAFVKGEGSYLYDSNGKKYIDFGSGIAVTNLGHCHPHVTEAVKKQSDILWHTSNLYINELQIKLADRLSAASFGGELFFCNSGAEANEAAIKLARLYNKNVFGGGKPRILTMIDGFHGRTYATISATAQEKIQKGFEPIAPYFSYIKYNDIQGLEAELSKGDVCAVMMELFQGESGVLPADKEFVKAVRDLTEKTGALMILDEVQTGYGRTGKMFAYELFDIVPDIMTLAKAIANGLPMGAIVAKPEVAAYFTPGTHGSTFGGGFIVCAAANAVLDVMLTPGFLQDVKAKGEQMQEVLKKALNPLGAVVRGEGLLVGVELPVDNKEFIKNCLKEGLVLITGGTKSARFYPPLTASMEEITAGVAIAEKVLKSMNA